MVAERLVQPEDVKEAVTWYTGISVRHVPGERSTRRVATAKRIYWGALRELGLSLEEIAEHTGCTYSTVQSMLAKSPPEKCYVQGVLARAKEQVAAQ